MMLVSNADYNPVSEIIAELMRNTSPSASKSKTKKEEDEFTLYVRTYRTGVCETLARFATLDRCRIYPHLGWIPAVSIYEVYSWCTAQEKLYSITLAEMLDSASDTDETAQFHVFQKELSLNWLELIQHAPSAQENQNAHKKLVLTGEIQPEPADQEWIQAGLQEAQQLIQPYTSLLEKLQAGSQEQTGQEQLEPELIMCKHDYSNSEYQHPDYGTPCPLEAALERMDEDETKFWLRKWEDSSEPMRRNMEALLLADTQPGYWQAVSQPAVDSYDNKKGGGFDATR